MIVLISMKFGVGILLVFMYLMVFEKLGIFLFIVFIKKMVVSIICLVIVNGVLSFLFIGLFFFVEKLMLNEMVKMVN